MHWVVGVGVGVGVLVLRLSSGIVAIIVSVIAANRATEWRCWRGVYMVQRH